MTPVETHIFKPFFHASDPTHDASTSDEVDDNKDKSVDDPDHDDEEEEIGTDGVTSEGEKAPNEGIQVSF